MAAVATEAPLVLDDAMWRALELMGAEMGESAESQEAFARWAGSIAEVGTVGIAAGFLTWFLRGGSLLTSLLSSMPLWSRFDPLPVLAVCLRYPLLPMRDLSPCLSCARSALTIASRSAASFFA